MANSVVADSEGKPEDVNALDDDNKSIELNGDNAKNGADEDDEDDEEEEEYEIEEILKHKEGQFPQGRTGYYVKWKGYGPKHNSWVDEQDAGNADELIAAYWEKKNKSASSRKGRKSTAAESPEPSTTTKKRRKSTVKDDDDEEETTSSKKKRVSRKKSESEEPILKDEDDAKIGEEEEQVYGMEYMQRFMKQASWEKLVLSVDTVEKPHDSDALIVYFKLKKDQRRVRLPAKLCNEKFPQLMLSFYESNLKWKETDVDDDMAVDS